VTAPVTDSGEFRVVPGDLTYLCADHRRRAARLVAELERWQDHGGSVSLPEWAGRAEGLLAAMLADTAAGGVPQ
jgi:hypothetical protein